MNVDFCDSISAQEQQAVKDWIENNKLQSCQIVNIDGIDYNLIVVFESDQIAAIRVIK